MPPRLLILDDEQTVRSKAGDFFRADGYAVNLAETADEGLRILHGGEIDLIVVDLSPGKSGQNMIDEILRDYSGIPIIILADPQCVEDAIACMRKGAYEYRAKPVDLKELALLVQRALSVRALEKENASLHIQLQDRFGLTNIIGRSPEMEHIFDKVRTVAPTKANVLITGESGTGKELIANAIHLLSERARFPFVKVHCSALASGVLESELFGHEKGAFTGASRLHRGRFELANRGTIFLDEIGDIDASLQVKLLRVLQERSFERVGGEETISVDVRLVTATNRDLFQMVEKGLFRDDLYYRLNVVLIHTPPLRERKGDIPLLVNSFLREYCRENGMIEKKIDQRTMAALEQYRWSGNVREMKNLVENLVVMSKGPIIQYSDLPDYIREEKKSDTIVLAAGKTLDEYERELILATLHWTGGNKSRAASVLGIGRKTLHRKLEEYGQTVS
ncbi:MAG: sigma-54 dependent transcriptional regulator [Spirochaetota bacterium]|jgi:DNA-binding NtrC family response regulator|nr:sigma-54 dependent transcriptional regulator [Spirochaetota bacterium]